MCSSLYIQVLGPQAKLLLRDVLSSSVLISLDYFACKLHIGGAAVVQSAGESSNRYHVRSSRCHLLSN